VEASREVKTVIFKTGKRAITDAQVEGVGKSCQVNGFQDLKLGHLEDKGFIGCSTTEGQKESGSCDFFLGSTFGGKAECP